MYRGIDPTSRRSYPLPLLLLVCRRRLLGGLCRGLGVLGVLLGFSSLSLGLLLGLSLGRWRHGITVSGGGYGLAFYTWRRDTESTSRSLHLLRRTPIVDYALLAQNGDDRIPHSMHNSVYLVVGDGVRRADHDVVAHPAVGLASADPQRTYTSCAVVDGDPAGEELICHPPIHPVFVRVRLFPLLDEFDAPEESHAAHVADML